MTKRHGAVVRRAADRVITDVSIADDALLAAACRGDPDAFAEIYHRYKGDVLRLAALTLHDRGEAEDVTQETFLKAYRARRSVRSGQALRPWLLTICRRTCLDRLRAHPGRPPLSLDAEDTDEPPTPAVDLDLRVDLRCALGRLQQEEYEAFVLVDVLGCHSDEAAAILGLRAPSTLRSRVARARRALVENLAEQEAKPAPQVWGLFHTATGSAIVACTGCAHHDRRRAEDLLARLQGTALPELPPGGRDGLELVSFFDRLEARIPPQLAVQAVVDEIATADALAIAGWIADHPRWQVRSSGSHTSWLGDVEQLLGRRSSVLTRLSGERPFLWTMAG